MGPLVGSEKRRFPGGGDARARTMAETIKSALFVDYDSFHRSQDDENGDTAERAAQTAAVWVAALEGGKLVPAAA